MDREQYEKDLKRRQKQHLNNIKRQQDLHWQPCLHDGCPECVGTGVKRDGRLCIHALSCPCPKCSPSCGAPFSDSATAQLKDGTTTCTSRT